jgi:UDP-GlcNAc:undecaprenyl-phosphate GlcNAc-1-phosphate transferase
VTRLALAFLSGLGVALLATLAAERLAPRVGLVTRPQADRWHRGTVPLGGGVAIMAGVAASALVAPPGEPRFTAFLLVALVMGAVGLADDLRPLRPQAKLVAQIVLAGVLIQLGFLLRLTPYPLVDVFLTVFWVVGVTNAFNLLDNMDGLAAGMAVVTAAFRLGFSLIDGQPGEAVLMAGFAGAAGGFLVRNFPPARIFMGDAGSLFIGFFLAGACLVGEQAYSRGIAAVLVLPVLLTAIPIFDTTFVTLTRLLTGRSIAQGGRDHTSHRLVGLGISERRAIAFLWGVSVLGGLLAVLSYRYGFTHTVVLLALLLVGLVLLGVHLSRVQVVTRETAAAHPAIVGLLANFPYKRHVGLVGLDLVLIVAAHYAAYALRFEGAVASQREAFLATVGPVIVLQLSALALLGCYRGLWRYTGLSDLLALVRAVTAGSVATVVYLLFATRFAGLSRAVFVLDWLLLVVFLTGSRVSFRVLREVLRGPATDFRRVLIYGAGDGGELVLREVRKNPALRREAVGFLDDDRAKVGSRIHDVPVLGGVEAAGSLVVLHRVGEVIVSSDKIPPERLRQLDAACAPHGVQVARAALRFE